MDNLNHENPLSNLEFEIRLSGFLLFLKWFFQVGAFLFLIGTIVSAIQSKEYLDILNGAIGFCFYWFLAKYAIRTFPRKVSLEGEMIVFHKIPKTWLDVNGIPVPLGITQRVVFPRAKVNLEWIGRTLSLNDMEKGKSIRLAAGKHAEELAAWFQSAGAPTPVGG